MNMDRPLLRIVGDELHLIAPDGGRRSLGPIDEVGLGAIPVDAVLDPSNLPDPAIVHAEALAFNFGSRAVARALRVVMDARLQRRPQRRYGLATGQLATHVEVGRWIDKGEEGDPS